jgi:thiol:disulfide interchange protein DsbA
MVGKRRIGDTLVLGFFVSLLLFQGMTTGTCADEVTLPSFGKGKTTVRLYTDYFCGPCSRMEPKIEGLLSDLVKRNVITVVFIDTPIHALTPLYARYFLYILNQDKRFDQALRSRAVLFEAAKDKLEETQKLEEYLTKHDVKFKQSDPTPTFTALSGLINEDGIRSTPTCVIVRGGKKAVYTGEAEISKALDLLK